jgi:hypothetical protein
MISQILFKFVLTATLLFLLSLTAPAVATTNPTDAEPAVTIDPAANQVQAQGYLGMLRIGLGNTAKEMCSCLFIVGRSESDCRDFVKLDEIDAHVDVNFHFRIVKASYFWVFSREASYSQSAGCRLR